jgi:hypothetical protein
MFLPIHISNPEDPEVVSPEVGKNQHESSDADPRDIELTWTSRNNPIPTPVENGGVCAGDHVVLSVTVPSIDGNPELDIVNSEIRVDSGLNVTMARPLVVPDEGYDAFNGVLNLSQFDVVYIENVRRGIYLDLRGFFTNNDSDFMAFWADTSIRTWMYATNVLGTQMTTGVANPEYTSYLPDRDGTLAFLCFDYDLGPGNWTLEAIQPPAEIVAQSPGNAVTLDTYTIGSNMVTSFEVICYSENGTEFQFKRSNVTITNLFPPEITSITVEGDYHIKTIFWEIDDLNEQEEHFAEIAVSRDNGVSFQRLASYLGESRYEWNSVSFINTTYIVRVRVYDNDPSRNETFPNLIYHPGLSDEIVSEPFLAGGLYYPGGPSTSPDVDSPNDVSMYYGVPGNPVGWRPNTDGTAHYVIRLNDSIFLEGQWEPEDETIDLPLETLEPGYYRFTISLSYPGSSFTEDDTINVLVLPDPGLFVRHGRQIVLFLGCTVCFVGVVLLVKAEIAVINRRRGFTQALLFVL